MANQGCSAGLISGASLQGSSTADILKNITHTIAVTLEVRNYSKWELVNPLTFVNSGFVKLAACEVHPGSREAMAMHKTDHTATGSSGTVSWEVEGVNKRLVVMWSAPYSFDFHTNWLAVGITDDSSMLGAPTFKEMYKGEETWFKRKEFYRDTNQLVFSCGRFEVIATMGTTHKTDIVIEVKPKDPKDFARNV